MKDAILLDALEPFRSALDADGLALEVECSVNRVLHLRISGDEHACKNCLLPTSDMEQMIGDALNAAGGDNVEVRITVEGIDDV